MQHPVDQHEEGRQPYEPPTLDDHGPVVDLTQQVRPSGEEPSGVENGFGNL